jgi:hypothetical protein
MGYEEQVKSEWEVVEGAEPDKSRVSKQVRHMVSAKHTLACLSPAIGGEQRRFSSTLEPWKPTANPDTAVASEHLARLV